MLKPEFREKPAGKVVLAPTLGPAVSLFCFPLQAKSKYWMLALNKIHFLTQGGTELWAEVRGVVRALVSTTGGFHQRLPPLGGTWQHLEQLDGALLASVGKGWDAAEHPAVQDSSPQWSHVFQNASSAETENGGLESDSTGPNPISAMCSFMNRRVSGPCLPHLQDGTNNHKGA